MCIKNDNLLRCGCRLSAFVHLKMCICHSTNREVNHWRHTSVENPRYMWARYHCTCSGYGAITSLVRPSQNQLWDRFLTHFSPGSLFCPIRTFFSLLISLRLCPVLPCSLIVDFSPLSYMLNVLHWLSIVLLFGLWWNLGLLGSSEFYFSINFELFFPQVIRAFISLFTSDSNLTFCLIVASHLVYWWQYLLSHRYWIYPVVYYPRHTGTYTLAVCSPET